MRQFNNAWHIVRMLAMIPITMKTVTYSVSFANNDSFRAPLTWEEALISPSLQMRKLRLWELKWHSQCYRKWMQGLKAVTLAPRNARLLRRGPHRNHNPQKVTRAGNVGKEQGLPHHSHYSVTLSRPWEQSWLLATRTHRSKRGADTFPCHPSTKQTWFHSSVMTVKTEMPV